jgi:predicted PurR-regulated permease PerM
VVLGVNPISMVVNMISINRIISLTGPATAVLGVLALLLALIIGLIIDAVRNLLEPIWDKLDQTDRGGEWWDYFFEGDEKFLQKLTDRYYTYYVFDVNSCITFMVSLPISVVIWHRECAWGFVGIVLFISTFILFCDAKSLRKEIKRLVIKERSKKTEDENGGENAT